MGIAAAAGLYLTIFLFLAAIASLLRPDQGADQRWSLKESLKASNRRMKLFLVRHRKKSRRKDALEQRLSAAGLPIKPEEFVVFQLFAALILGGLLQIITQQLLLPLLGAASAYMMSSIWLKAKQRKRIKQFNEGLPDMITSIIGSLKAGFSLPQSLQMIAEESYSPIKEETEFVIKSMQYGKNVEEAMIDWKTRMPSADLDLLVEAILIQRQVGGNLAYLLEKIVETMRERTRIEGQIRTLTAQGKLSGIIIGLLPAVLGFVIYLMNPEYMQTLFVETIGQIMLLIAAVSGVIGFLFVRKITTIEV
ncbi:type II secretion system F family protein [Bacillus daqingensis]|uniref:Type II secretion system F family protein n=1 Tax=Bacillus daqingensis TaxID=872396 RepID=A0ABV9P0A7_9BACI